jgi:hypothetical protein
MLEQKNRSTLIGAGLGLFAAAVVLLISSTAFARRRAGNTVKLRLTGYWPFSARPDERGMEGGKSDRVGNPLYTLEDFQAGKAPYVSLSGDDAAWPYGQRIEIDEFPGVIFRVVDTGSHFSSKKNKTYKEEGYEPIDVCVNSSSTKLPKTATAHIVKGDNFEKGKQVSVAYFKGQDVAVVGSDDLVYRPKDSIYSVGTDILSA